MDLCVPTPGQARNIALPAALDVNARELRVETAKTERNADLVAHRETLDKGYGPQADDPKHVKRTLPHSRPQREGTPSPAFAVGAERNRLEAAHSRRTQHSAKSQV